MKSAIALFLLVALAMVVVDAYDPLVQNPTPNKPKFPYFPLPFNPRPQRFPRSSTPKNKTGEISVNVKKEGREISWNVQGQQKIWGNKHGSIHVSGGVSKQPGSRPQTQIGVGGSFQWG